MEGTLVLPADVRITPVAELTPEVREKIGAGDGDFTITRPLSRVPSKVIDPEMRALLREFETPTTIVKAVLHFSRERRMAAAQVLDDAFPLLESFYQSRLLVDPESADAATVRASWQAGDAVAGVTIEENLAVIADTEIYRVRTGSGETAVLKIARPGTRGMERLLGREGRILAHAAPSGVTPALLGSGTHEERAWLLMEWCPGEDAATAAARLRGEGLEAALDLCARILDAYARLHAAGVTHGDVHARNIQVNEAGAVRLLDFGVAVADAKGLREAPRAGVAYFFEPEYAAAVRAGTAPPPASAASDQYALAALCYFLITGEHTLPFSPEKAEMMRQIHEDAPVPLARRGVRAGAWLEATLFRALDKDPARRFPSVAALAAAFGEGMRSGAAPEAGPAPVAPAARIATKLRAVLDTLGDPEAPRRYRGPESPTASVTYGSAGIAHMLGRLACLWDDAKLLALADRWALRAVSDGATDAGYYSAAVQISPETVGRISPYHCASGVHLTQALIAAAMADEASLGRSLEAYLAESAGECDKLDLTLGRLSTVIGLALALDELPEASAARAPLVELGNRRVAEVWKRLDELEPIAACRQEQYLGIAHGWAGFAYTALRWTRSSGAAAPDSVERRLEELAALGERNGSGMRWPFHLGRRGPGSHMAGWCNGTAGFLELWTMAHGVLGDDRYLELAGRAATECAAARGGIHSLCCGAAGVAFALLALYNRTGEKKWLEAARRQTLAAVEASDAAAARQSDELPFSLYKGDVGLALACAAVEQPELAAMPFF